MSVGRCGRCAGGREVSERFSSSSRPAAHRSMSVGSSLCCRYRARSARGVRTARGRCGACTRSARASCCAISYCAELGSGGGGWPSQTAWRNELLRPQMESRAEKWFKGRARARRIPRSNRHPTTPIVLRGVRASSTESAILPKRTVP